MAQGQGGEKTEQPSAKRLRDAKKKGQVAKSQDLSSAALMLAAVAVIWLSSGYIGNLFLTSVADQIAFAVSFKGDFTQQIAFSALYEGLKIFLLALTPLLAVMMLVAFGVNYLQVGSIFSFESVKPNFGKLNPTEGFKNKFLKSRPYIEVGKTIIKIIITAVIVGWALSASVSDLIKLTNQPVQIALIFVFNLVLGIFFKVGLAFLVIGGADYFLQVYLHRRELMMTKQEVKQEYKEMEGDPYIKAKRKWLHREIISQSMAQAVKGAAVVVANPTHLSIALRYDKGEMGAPTIVAKGADNMAAQIRQLAEENGIPITRNVPLARALYEFDIDDEVPEELYEAVAVVMRWVYELKEETVS